MIEVEGYKAFHGKLIVSPVSQVEPFTLEGDFLYKPEADCWYGQGRSFPASICTIVEYPQYKATPAVYVRFINGRYVCPTCSKQQKNTYKNRARGCYCERCGIWIHPFKYIDNQEA